MENGFEVIWFEWLMNVSYYEGKIVVCKLKYEEDIVSFVSNCDIPEIDDSFMTNGAKYRNFS